jgi:Ca-activated chloride channel family protein
MHQRVQPATVSLEAPRSSHIALSLTFLFILFWWPLTPSAQAQETLFMEMGAATVLEASPRTMTPGEATSGTLLFRAIEKGKFIQAPMEASDVKIEVTGLMARTRVTQSFYNPTDGWLEGIYVFPLPEDAAVDTLKMQIGERFIEGDIKERGEAKRIYEAAKAEGKKSSLLEQERPNIFTNSVANIGPGELVVIQIEYQQGLKLEAGEVRLRFPMVVAPRFNPATNIQMVSLYPGGFSGSDPVPDRDRITPPAIDPRTVPENFVSNPVSLDITLRSGFPLETVESTFHGIVQKKLNTETISISLAGENVPADRDFELIWKAKKDKAPTAALFKETFRGEDYIYALLTPPVSLERSKILPREVIFVIDNSGSMGGTSIAQAKESLDLALQSLQPTDRFNVIRFDDTMDMVFPAPVAADVENVGAARAFVKRLDANGGTIMLPALKAALFDQTPNNTKYLRQVIFLTDGAIGNEDQLFEAIGQTLGRSRLFTVGIGSAPNSHFMNRAASIGRGTFTHIGNLAQVSDRMNALFAKLEAPVLTDIKARFPKGAKVEAWPDPLPDLYAGEPILISAKLGEAKGKLVIEGMFEGKRWAMGLKMKNAKEGTGIAKIWARRKIASVEQSRFEGRAHDEIESMVLKTALDYGLVSRLTSLVAVDVTKSRPDGEPLNSAEVPVNFPAGWEFEKVFGETMPAKRTLRASAGGVQQFAMLAAPAPAPSMDAAVRQKSSGINLPQGATPKDLQRLIGLILLAMALTVVAVRRAKRA